MVSFYKSSVQYSFGLFYQTMTSTAQVLPLYEPNTSIMKYATSFVLVSPTTTLSMGPPSKPPGHTQAFAHNTSHRSIQQQHNSSHQQIVIHIWHSSYPSARIKQYHYGSPAPAVPCCPKVSSQSTQTRVPNNHRLSHILHPRLQSR